MFLMSMRHCTTILKGLGFILKSYYKDELTRCFFGHVTHHLQDPYVWVQDPNHHMQGCIKPSRASSKNPNTMTCVTKDPIIHK